MAGWANAIGLCYHAAVIDRREFLSMAATAALPKRPPNVVLIYCDDLGYGDLGCYGSNIRTPNIDRLANEGTRFTHFYSGNPVCSPSRAALLTGRYPVRAGVPRVLFPRDSTGLPHSEVTLAQVLKTKQYQTMCVGKWHLGHHPPYLPTARGFDHYFGIPYSNDMAPRWLMDDTKVIEEQATLETLTPRYTERAVRFIEQSKGSPFFLYMPHTYPHIPLAASERFRGKSPLGLYGDVIEELDWSVGEVMTALKRTGQEKDTLVMFSSDNGPWFQGSPGRLRGRKGTTWEGGQRVPFLAKLPGWIPARKTCNGVSSVMDIVPTVTRLCGAELPRNPLDGIDIGPLLTGVKQQLEREALLYFNGLNLQCARWDKWKLHLARHNTEAYMPSPPGGVVNLPLSKPELYDVVNDPDESYDAAPENRQVVEQIVARVDRLTAGMPQEVRDARAATLARQVSQGPAGAMARPLK